MANILNCNPRNGDYITETSARTLFYGVEDSISNIYLNARKNDKGEIAGSGDFSYLLINGMKFDKTHSKSFYEALWYQFLFENNDIAEKLRTYDDFYDGLPEKANNSSARVFRLLKNYGMNGLYSNIKPFLTELKERKRNENTVKEEPKSVEEMLANPDNTEDIYKENPLDAFNNMDLIVKRVISKYYKTLTKAEMLECDEVNSIKDKETLRKLLNIRYDEKEGNCTKVYASKLLTSLRGAFTKGIESNGNKITLE